jgi:hypothetical protein
LVVTKDMHISVGSDQEETYLKLVVTKERLILVGTCQGEIYLSWY